jgi:hypothetical protein
MTSIGRDSDDMSLIDDEEDQYNQQPLPQLDFTFSKAAWDDTELVNAYDAAMDEFHVSSFHL